jgi:redox-sensitive bicupin YhaK (pirin superfamily)
VRPTSTRGVAREDAPLRREAGVEARVCSGTSGSVHAGSHTSLPLTMVDIRLAAERQDVPIVTHGPFVGETPADLLRVSQAYAQGRMPRVSELSKRVAH